MNIRKLSRSLKIIFNILIIIIILIYLLKAYVYNI